MTTALSSPALFLHSLNRLVLFFFFFARVPGHVHNYERIAPIANNVTDPNELNK